MATRNSFPCLLTVLLLFTLSSPGFAASLDLGARIQSFTLKNGLRLLVLERALSPTVAVYVRFRAGAVDEMNGKTGAAHLLEHMLFKGTETIGSLDPRREREVMKKIERVGVSLDRQLRKGVKADIRLVNRISAELQQLQEDHRRLFRSNEIDRLYTEQGAVSLNASTAQDLTTYHVSLPANRLELWARIESDRMLQPVFREFYSERDVVQQERRQRKEADPDGTLLEHYLATAFTVHPYRRPVIGLRQDIPFLDMTYLRRFFRQTHGPNNMVIAIVGAVQTKDVLALVTRYFGPIPARRLARSTPRREPPQRAERRVEVAFAASPQMIMGFHKPAPPARVDYAFDILEALLTGGKTSRLYRTIVEAKGLAKNIRAYNVLPGVRYPNQFALFATPRQPHTCQELESAISEELQRLGQQAVGEAELSKVKHQLQTDFLRGLNSNEGLARMLSYYESALGDYRYLLRYPDRIGQVTAAEVREAAATYLVKENRTVATLVRRP